MFFQNTRIDKYDDSEHVFILETVNSLNFTPAKY